MIDLQPYSGMPLSLAEGGRLIAGQGLELAEPVPRMVSELRGVLADPDRAREGVAYLMYRGVAPSGSAADLAAHAVRFDVTVIFPGLLGPEYVKTAGHYHPAAPSGVAYPEVYEVLHGRAAFLLQRAAADRIDDAAIIYADPGDKVNLPPGYGHVTINVGDDPLVVCNIVADGFPSVYDEYVRRRGAAYYLFATPDGPLARANPNYDRLPPLRSAQPHRDACLGLTDEPLFVAWRRQPELFSYLCHPERLPIALRP